ncbi:hypothetical protein L211DRAFT_850204 [Terfezia boudieri ATCC MYA-4762]|uniref:Uncharacterized protein n=1 Tax=Terfezia boudieri ATCC MYA-4762 TaxID=1051890 RepID=A0A3N4LIP9_9PEZI|nr:hypothetical protein L211DRAFT_850204 [Terfezia boudieri ATCC MYA-4762]
MKVLSILILTLLGALAVLAAPGPKPFPGELAMVEARAAFEGTQSSGPPGTDNKEPDSVPPHPKVSVNPGGALSIGAVTSGAAHLGTTAVGGMANATGLGRVRGLPHVNLQSNDA